MRMKFCLYSRQFCKWQESDYCSDEDLRPMFAAAPERAVKKVWACRWAGRRLTIKDYLLLYVESGARIDDDKKREQLKVRILKALGDQRKEELHERQP